MKRLVVVELKLGEFRPEHKGQVELYLKWLARHDTQPDEKPPIAIILCTTKDAEIVELLDLEKDHIHIAEYWLELPPRVASGTRQPGASLGQPPEPHVHSLLPQIQREIIIRAGVPNSLSIQEILHRLGFYRPVHALHRHFTQAKSDLPLATQLLVKFLPPQGRRGLGQINCGLGESDQKKKCPWVRPVPDKIGQAYCQGRMMTFL